MKTLSLKLPESVDALLAGEARKRGVTKSALAREAIEGLLSQTGRRRRSVADLAGDLMGCIEGPADLSTNPRYMEDFGR